MRRLYLHQIDDAYDIERDLAVGPRCFYGREQRVPGWEKLDFVNPLATPNQQFAESARIRSLALELLPKYVEKLNRQHNRNYSQEYWRILLLPWLINMLMVARKRYLEIQALKDRHEDEAIVVRVWNSFPDWDFIDDDELWDRGLRYPDFDFWLSSIMCAAIAPVSWRLEHVEKTTPPRHRTAAMPDANESIPRRVRRKVLGRSQMKGIAGIGFVSETLFSVFMTLANACRSSTVDIPAGQFAGQQQHNFEEEFLAVLDRMLSATFPRTYGIDYRRMEAFARAKSYRNGCLFILPGGPLHHDVYGKFEAAHAYEAGEKIVGVQHGAGPGASKNFVLFSEIEYQHHAFISWGWRAHYPYTDRAAPLPAPLLSKLPKRGRPNNDMILVGTEIPVSANRISSEPEGPGLLAYREFKAAFIQDLDEQPRGALSYRPYRNATATFDDLPYLHRRCGTLSELEGDLLPRLLSARLNIIDYPGTPMTFAMVSNAPLLLMWDDQSWPWNEDAIAQRDELEQVGIYHRTPQSAAQFVNKNWDDIDTWWSSACVQQARKNWVSLNGRHSNFWWWHWLREIWTLTNMPRRIAKSVGSETNLMVRAQ